MTRKLLKSLLKAGAYPEPTAEVRLIETHVSYIFISDRHVYKVKKPVDFGFLNFTTLDRRRFYCEEEVRLNRRLCPDTYLGVVELRETPDGGSFAGGGAVIDYAVKMKRLPEERMLSRLIERGEVTPQQMAQLALVVARFHERADRGTQIAACGATSVIRGNWEENFRQAAQFQDETVTGRDLAFLRGWVERFLAGHEELFRARVDGGFIRECDGDLHSGNICLTDPVCIFDCIEFNERFRYIDTAADISFLLMDLEYCGRPDLGAAFLEAYGKATGDGGCGALLVFYQAYRAFVRGKVLSFRLRQPALGSQERSRLGETARRYFRLARGYALRSQLPPSLLLTCGMMGSGKSALARQLSFELGLRLERSDVARKRLFPPETAPGPEGDAQRPGFHGGIYREECNRATYEALFEAASGELSAGRGIIVDATFRRAEDRERFRRLARELGAGCYLLETRCPEKVIRERLERRSLDPHELSDGRWEIFHEHKAEFEEPAPGEAIRVDSAQPVDGAVDQALKGMGLLP